MTVEQLLIALAGLVLTAAVRYLSNQRVGALRQELEDERDDSAERISNMRDELESVRDSNVELEKRCYRLACQLARHGISEACPVGHTTEEAEDAIET